MTKRYCEERKMTRQTKKQTRKREYGVGDDIYLPTEIHLSRGRDDFDGGLCRIIETGDDGGWKWFRVAENPSAKYSMNAFVKDQKRLEKEYAGKVGKRNPDYSFESNCWACPGDIVDGRVIDYYIP